MVLPSSSEENRIRVTGEGPVEAIPDTSTVVLGVTTEQKDLVGGQQDNARESTKIIQPLLKAGIPAEDIRTSDYRVETVYDYKDGTQIFRGYKITHLLQVRIADLQKIGSIVDTAVQNGANYVSDIHFMVREKDRLYQEAIKLAVKNAYEKAYAISSAIGVKMDNVPIAVVEGQDMARPFMEYQGPMVKGVSTSTPVQPGKLKIEASVTAVYQYSRP